MPITLGSNIASLTAQRQLSRASSDLSSVFERLSSGQRINRASDDAAGLAIASTLSADRRVFSQGVRNLNDGLSALNIADSTLAELSSVVTRIRELAQQSSNGSLSNTQRESIDIEAQALSDEFFRISRSTDFNGLNLFDGTLADGLRLQAGYGTDGGILSSLGGALGTGELTSKSNVSSGGGGTGIVSADFNGDGILDLASAQYSNETVQVFLGNGDGSFEAQAAASFNQAYSIATADFNGDGIFDLAVGSYGASELGILIGNGDGTFQDVSVVSTNDLTFDIQVGDFNGDGIQDIAAASYSDTFEVLLGSGDGSFTTSDVFTGTTAYSSNLSVGDFNGDGILDILNGDDSGDINVNLGNGDGTFQARISSSSSGGVFVSSTVGDFNGDGILDVATTSYSSNQGVVLLGNGDGTFTESFSGIFGDRRSAIGGDIETADFNGDGILDLVTASYGGSSNVYIGQGDGTFQSATAYPVSPGASGSVTTGDFNSDGVVDFASTDYDGAQIDVYTGNTEDGISPILDFSLATLADARQSISILDNKLSSLSEQRGVIGAFQARIASAISTLSSTGENYASAESRIRDADIAFESSNLTRLNILQQAGTAILAQANQQPALAIALLTNTG
ncbi:MAG: VCBS repeat-containing protein [Bdellovibrionales bacterium]|nr:VCBS repeat-containing protein [Bdellovibrionales bacterium]